MVIGQKYLPNTNMSLLAPACSFLPRTLELYSIRSRGFTLACFLSTIKDSKSNYFQKHSLPSYCKRIRYIIFIYHLPVIMPVMSKLIDEEEERRLDNRAKDRGYSDWKTEQNAEVQKASPRKLKAALALVDIFNSGDKTPHNRPVNVSGSINDGIFTITNTQTEASHSSGHPPDLGLALPPQSPCWDDYRWKMSMLIGMIRSYESADTESIGELINPVYDKYAFYSPPELSRWLMGPNL